MQLIINGQTRDFPSLATGLSLAELMTALELKSDRVAVEHNGAIVPRTDWPSTPLAESDRLEMVHFVGGGSPRPAAAMVVRFALRGWLLLLLAVAAEPAHSLQLAAPDINAPTFVVNDLKPGQDLRILAYGDMRFTNPANTSDTWPVVRKWLAGQVAAEHPDAMLVSGDIPFQGSDPADWKVFEQEAAAWRVDHLRVYPTVGNHEIIPSPASGYANYFSAFPELHGYHIYSVLIGNAYVLALNATEPIWPNGYQADWLKAQLDHIPSQVDFIFVLIHVPMIADVQSEFLANIPSPDLLHLREYLEGRAATMRQKFVVVAGHIHNYERFEQKGITHIISGGGGAKPYPIYMAGPEDLYHDPAYPNFNYVIFSIHGSHADAVMYRVADPTGPKFSMEVKDRFSLDAKSR